MLTESQLNIYILGTDLPPRQRERIQAQLQTAIRSIPSWAFKLLQRRIDELGARNLPLVIEPRTSAEGRVMSLGRINGRPAARLMPRLSANSVDWGQDQRYLVAKSIAYMASPAQADSEFWAGWSRALESDGLRARAQEIAGEWAGESELGLLVEMFAAYALNSEHRRWSDLPAVRAFLDAWR